MSTRQGRRDLLIGSILMILVIFTLFPYVFMVVTSLKDNDQFHTSYWIPSLPFHWENYTAAWNQISVYIMNSLIVACTSMIGVLVLSSIAAFVFARYKFLGRNFLFTMIAALLMVPSISSLVPLFILVRDMGLINTRLALILPYMASGSIFATFLMRTFFQQVPNELFEAAHIDGAAGWQAYFYVMLPLSGPIIGTIILLTLTTVWNDYFWPLLTLTDDNLRTVTTGLAFLQGQNVTLWGPLFAGYVLASLPLVIVYFFASRYFIAGVGGVVGGGDMLK
ncbi:carbohydrate ABC transporter permease [Dictyobacter kobayashii]|uniref:Sugar ABC transporter permease n=1 Tax=Dictyobacter kobayashii TaxID=2014872 RepID=A0A402ARY8_9CHLR|nr:carbohydrate ABC transporter permease [Dictyobacter kobayashii]GCE21865.1 sugar ABC transporter permease [Dictyobacter kobayashii]